MDLLKLVHPNISEDISYKAANNLTSTVRADIYLLKNNKIVVIATETIFNQGPSITNSIEDFAKAIRDKYPGKHGYYFIESYRWDKEEPSFDVVGFEGKDFEYPFWRRLDKPGVEAWANMIKSFQVKASIKP